MSMLIATSLIFGAVSAPMPEAEFEGRFRAALTELSAPLVILEEETTDGLINAFDEESKSFTVQDEAGQTHAFTWNDDTQWLLNGEKVTRKEALVAGREVQVKHNSDDLAGIVSVTSK